MYKRTIISALGGIALGLGLSVCPIDTDRMYMAPSAASAASIESISTPSIAPADSLSQVVTLDKGDECFKKKWKQGGLDYESVYIRTGGMIINGDYIQMKPIWVSSHKSYENGKFHDKRLISMDPDMSYSRIERLVKDCELELELNEAKLNNVQPSFKTSLRHALKILRDFSH